MLNILPTTLGLTLPWWPVVPQFPSWAFVWIKASTSSCCLHSMLHGNKPAAHSVISIIFLTPLKALMLAAIICSSEIKKKKKNRRKKILCEVTGALGPSYRETGQIPLPSKIQSFNNGYGPLNVHLNSKLWLIKTIKIQRNHFFVRQQYWSQCL